MYKQARRILLVLDSNIFDLSAKHTDRDFVAIS
jgi:hypothetical protein